MLSWLFHRLCGDEDYASPVLSVETMACGSSRSVTNISGSGPIFRGLWDFAAPLGGASELQATMFLHTTAFSAGSSVVRAINNLNYFPSHCGPRNKHTNLA